MSLVGFHARNHPQQVGKSGAKDTVDERITPPRLWQQLHYEFGFTLDAAANAKNTKLPDYFDLESDGLLRTWGGIASGAIRHTATLVPGFERHRSSIGTGVR